MSGYPTPGPIDFLEIFKPVKLPPCIFPGYIAMRIKNALLLPTIGVTAPNRDFPGAVVGAVETVGDCRYAIEITDADGTIYEVAIRVKS